MNQLIGEVQINVPFRLLKTRYLDVVVANRINPEIGIDGEALDQFPISDFSEIARLLHDEGLSVTLHAPFLDMVPGSPDRIMREATLDRLKEAFALLDIFKPKTIVCHTGFDDRRYPNLLDSWLEASIDSWAQLLELTRQTGTKIMLENVYEATPDLHLGLLSKFAPEIGFCFDLGHWNVFSRLPMRDWLEKLSSFIGQVHLHDNSGKADGHLSIGCGNINFRGLFSFLENLSLRPVITLEPHREEDVFTSLEALLALWPWQTG